MRGKDWVLDLDVRAFFDSVPHDLLMKAVAHHTDERWVLLYIQRWLKAPMTMRDGTTAPREMGVGAGNSAVVVDLPRCGPMLSPRVPNLVPIPGPRMERETPGQRPRPNYGHPHASEAVALSADHFSRAPSCLR